LLKEYQVVYLKEVSRNVVNTKASTAFVQRLIVASSLLSSMRVAYIALAAAKRGAGCALHVTLDFISRTPVTLHHVKGSVGFAEKRGTQKELA
jgi:hypothetical protein